MTPRQEKNLVDKIEALIDDMNAPNKHNQIKNERLQYMIALLLASDHNVYWTTEGMDIPESDDNFVAAANEMSEAFELIEDLGVRINIEVMEEAKNKS